jgi:hypothetical protein
MGTQPYTDILGMGDPGDRPMPAIVCLDCSMRWPNADAFWAAATAAEDDTGEAGGDGEPAGDFGRDPAGDPGSDPAHESTRNAGPARP